MRRGDHRRISISSAAAVNAAASCRAASGCIGTPRRKSVSTSANDCRCRRRVGGCQCGTRNRKTYAHCRRTAASARPRAGSSRGRRWCQAVRATSKASRSVVVVGLSADMARLAPSVRQREAEPLTSQLGTYWARGVIGILKIASELHNLWCAILGLKQLSLLTPTRSWITAGIHEGCRRGMRSPQPFPLDDGAPIALLYNALRESNSSRPKVRGYRNATPIA